MNGDPLLALISKQRMFKVIRWGGAKSGEEDTEKEERVEATIATGANVVSSRSDEHEGYHRVLLDLDVPAYLVQSTTPGHSHLYIDVAVPSDKYFDLLDTLADCGILEPGYAAVSRKKGSSMLRLPWVRKGE